MSENVTGAPVELETRSIGSLLKQYAIPGIIAMTATSLYNMVDSIFIGHLPGGDGPMALAALGICNPIMNLGAALGTLVGVGASTIISVMLGQHNYRSAQKVLGNEVTMNIILGLLFAAVVLVWEEPLLRFFGASDVTLPFAKQYLTVILIGNVITHLYFGLNSLIRACGNPKLAMGLTLFTVISNTVLDPVFIFALDIGVQGAAVATVLCQFLALIWAIRFFTRKTSVVHFGPHILEIHWKIAKSSLLIGMGPFLMNSAACLVNLFINQQLLRYGGDLHIGAFGVMSRFSFLFLMVVMGLNQGMQPIAGYNYGARKYRRVRKVYLLTAFWATAVTTLGFLISMVFPRTAVSIFTSDQALIDIGARGMRCMNVSFFLVGMQMVSTNFFQCLGMVRKSIFLSLTRQLLFLVPMLYLLPRWLGVDGVWFSYPAADVISFTITTIMVVALMRKFKKLNDGESSSALGGYEG